mmetsp:Transcript_48262/g.124549  ORF Transcript_48262/g.124549 Transcript_48262/m.124549 type:complete len:271 (-) Transcript_48262:15-827(-)
MIVANMFVAILTEWYRRVIEDEQVEETKVETRVGMAYLMRGTSWQGAVKRLVGSWGFYLKAEDEVESREQEVNKSLKRADLRTTDYIRQALVSGQTVTGTDLARHFHGDVSNACSFVQKVKALAEAESQRSGVTGLEGLPTTKEEVKNQELEQLRKLQRMVESLEDHVKQVRSALHFSNAAPLKDGQALEGYMVEPLDEEEELASPPGQWEGAGVGAFPDAPDTLPGAMPGTPVVQNANTPLPAPGHEDRGSVADLSSVDESARGSSTGA